MAGFALTHYGEGYVLNWLCHGKLPDRMNLFLGYLTSNPGETGTGSEVSGNGYSRVQLVDVSTPTATTVFGPVTPNIAPDTGSYCPNTSDVEFPISTGNQGAVTHIGIWDAATAGNMIAYKALLVPQTVTAGQQVKFPVGKLKITAD